ncbi:DUF6233 domain-containing protein [Streptomyces ziwulingensis]
MRSSSVPQSAQKIPDGAGPIAASMSWSWRPAASSQGASVDAGLLPVQVSEHPDQLRGVDGIHLGMQPLDLCQHGLPGAVAPLLGLAKAGGRGPGRGGVVHAVDCAEAPAGTPVLPLDRALDAAEQPGVRLCSLCGAAAELDPFLTGFDRGFDET